jgi:hypothetical protein
MITLLLAAGLAASEVPEPKLSFVPLSIPWLAVGALGSYEGFSIGPTVHDFKLLGGYFWSRNYVFDPASVAPVPAPGVGAGQLTTDDWRVAAEWDVHLKPGLTLGPAVLVHGGGPQATGSYDADLAGGWSAMAGPALRWRKLDELAFPTDGEAVDLSFVYGRHWGAASLDFQKGELEVVRYFRLAPDQALALRGMLGGGTPRLPWLDKWTAGGGDYVRGYQWWRFTGDRVASAGLEYRNLIIPDLGAPIGLKLPIVPGLAVTVHLDAGRAWESAQGVPVGSDPRIGGGIGFVATLDRTPLGRLELDASPEGIYPVVAFSTSY